MRQLWYRTSLDVHWDRLKFAIAWAVPRWLVELCAIRVWANATTGELAHVEAPGVTVDEAVRVWRRQEGGDGTYSTDEVMY